MVMETVDKNMTDKLAFITKHDVQNIIANDINAENYEIVSYKVYNASNKMLGFLADYWKLEVLVNEDENPKLARYFIKAVSRTNEAKAAMVKELKLFEKELFFYTTVKSALDFPGIKPWSARLITSLEDAIIFKDLNFLNYKLRDKLKRFDMPHTLQALRTLARFHASTFIYEERRTKELNRVVSVKEEFKKVTLASGYNDKDSWFMQCKQGALETLKIFSKYRNNPQLLDDIEKQWSNIWSEALRVSDGSTYHNVICHRDLWNNNLMFHYNNGLNEPDDCLFVDFQAISFQPPAGDVMLLLYCNLEPKLRESNLKQFLNFYYRELENILNAHDISLNKILPLEVFIESAEEQRLWGIIVCACLLPQFYLDEDFITSTFRDTAQFDQILSKDKASFIKRNMEMNSDYKYNVITIFEEIVDRYCKF